jgi:hypothetical protein
MRLSKCLSFLLTAALVVPAGLWASTQPCQTSAPTALSNTWNFPKEASELLNRIQVQAYAAKEDAEGLTTLTRFHQVSWQLESDHLARVKAHVNNMGKDLCRLQVIRRATLPWQQHEIDRITPMLKELAARTQVAIDQFKGHEQTYWATNLPTDWSEITAEASQLNNSVMRQVEYAKLHTSPSSASATSSGM